METEDFAVMTSIGCSNWLVSCSAGFDLYTYHNNLIFIFDPLAAMPDICQATTRMALNWAVHLPAYNYVRIHIAGDDNVWAAFVTSWTLSLTNPWISCAYGTRRRWIRLSYWRWCALGGGANGGRVGWMMRILQ